MPKASKQLTRLFSSVSSVLAKKATANDLSKSDISKAINLLNSKISLFKNDYINETDRNNYINQFTSALNRDLRNSTDVESHFDRSIFGLTSLLASNAQSKDGLDYTNPVQVKNHIAKNKNNEQELIKTFEMMLHNGAMTLGNSRLLILNLKRSKSLKQLLESLEFYKEFDAYKILITTRALMLKDLSLAHSLYDSNIDCWLTLKDDPSSIINESRMLEKSLYQVIYKVKQDLSVIIEDPISPRQYITLIESLPRQVHIWETPADLTSNQELLVRFMKYLTTKPKASQSLKKLIKLSVDNKIYKTDILTIEESSVLRFRFINGLTGLSEDLMEIYKDKELLELHHELSKDDETLHNENVVLKFV